MKTYLAVNQYHSGSAPGDAITNQMLSLQRDIRSLGFASEIFASHVPVELTQYVRSIRSYAGSRDSLLLFHHSIGSDDFDDVMGLPDDVVVVFHNITPEHYFADEAIRRYVRLGRDQLTLLARRAKLGVADSNFNRREMLDIGFTRVEVLPVRTDFTTISSVRKLDSERSTDWLFVGRIVANKCQTELVRAFATYCLSFDNAARLFLVGDVSDRNYVDEVRREAALAGIDGHVVFTGKLSDADLAAMYASVGLYVSLSEHEGFGVPLLEAMAASVPVLAFAAAAVPETMGNAGILLSTKDPRVVAALAQILREDDALRERLIARQITRFERIRDFDTQGLLRRVISRAAGVVRPLEVQVQGPFETSYSLASLNRSLALQLASRTDMAVSIYATEGPGDYEPKAEDLARHPRAAELYRRSADVPYPDVVIRQLWPPRIHDSPGGSTFSYFGWEESGLPSDFVKSFNTHLAGIGVMSTFVENVLRDAGVVIPIAVVGVGVEPHDPGATFECDELADLRSFRFLNIGSAFPRKGVDSLIEAYFAEFTGADDVSLILKTFPNPHNRLGEQLEQARAAHPNPPDVRWIDRDVDAHALQGLYNLASCYVHPARGEGFGLPVAEAMLANIPVISIEYSGLADLVCDETAATIGFTIEPADTHLTVPGSVWAEPDIADLRSSMRSMFDGADHALTRQRVLNARRRVETDFSWAAVGRRWADFILRTEPTRSPTHVAMVSTWNSRCGIAEYTRFLVTGGAQKFTAAIFANKDAEILDPAADAQVIRCWNNRWSPELDELGAALDESDADVAHIQFNFGFFELGHLARLIEDQRTRRGVVVTFHRTQDIETGDGLISLREIAPTLQRVDRIVVHQARDAEHLATLGIRENVVIVPQGTPDAPRLTHSAARAALGLGERPIVGTFGFLLPHKGTLELLDVVERLRPEFPDIAFLALCASYPDPISAVYEAEVRDVIAARDLDDNVVLMTDYLPVEVARSILRAADVIVLPYQHTEESSSAAMRFVMSIQRPVIATDIAIFDDASAAFYKVPAGDTAQLAATISRFITDESLRQQWASRASAYSRKTSWDRASWEHQRIYAQARDQFVRRT